MKSLLIVIIFAAFNVCAQLTLPSIFADNMILQRDMKIPVWGKSAPEAKVTVSFRGQKKITSADKEGNWKLYLSPMDADRNPQENPPAHQHSPVSAFKKGGLNPRKMLIESDNSKIIFTNILVGEVWLCSGQSNMKFPMSQEKNAKKYIPGATNSNIRFFQTGRLNFKPYECDNCQGHWEICTTNSVRNLTAIGYYFGLELYSKINIPIGLIQAEFSGTIIESWMNSEDLKKWHVYHNELETLSKFKNIQKFNYYNKKEKLNKKKSSFRLWQNTLTVQYNSKIHPLIPYAIRGVIWYQGESNRHNSERYKDLFTTMIKSWRDEWGEGDFPFYFVQIAPFDYGTKYNSAFVQEAQFFALKLTNTGMAVTMDVGNIKNIHPKNKKAVGHRLALWALAKDYGYTNLVFSGPLYKNYKIDGNKFIISFDYAKGLKTRDDKPPTYFEITGKDKVFHPAKTKIINDKIVVSSDKVKLPVAVRFAWSNIAEPNLCNHSGLPASPFRTDNWKQEK